MKSNEYYEEIGTKIGEARREGNSNLENKLLVEAFGNVFSDSYETRIASEKKWKEDEKIREEERRRNVQKYVPLAEVVIVLFFAGIIYGGYRAVTEYMSAKIHSSIQTENISSEKDVLIERVNLFCERKETYTTTVKQEELKKILETYLQLQKN